MRTAIALLGMLLFPAILTAQAGAVPDPLFVRIRGFNQVVRLDTMVLWRPVSSAPAETFRNVRAILDSLAIPVGTADSVAARIHHNGILVRTRFAGLPVSRSLRCGMGLAGEYADMWRVNLAYAIYVRPDSMGSRLGMALVGGASDIEGTSKAPVQCGTTGGLETLIARLIEQKARQ